MNDAQPPTPTTAGSAEAVAAAVRALPTQQGHPLWFRSPAGTGGAPGGHRLDAVETKGDEVVVRLDGGAVTFTLRGARLRSHDLDYVLVRCAELEQTTPAAGEAARQSWADADLLLTFEAAVARDGVAHVTGDFGLHLVPQPEEGPVDVALREAQARGAADEELLAVLRREPLVCAGRAARDGLHFTFAQVHGNQAVLAWSSEQRARACGWTGRLAPPRPGGEVAALLAGSGLTLVVNQGGPVALGLQPAAVVQLAGSLRPVPGVSGQVRPPAPARG